MAETEREARGGKVKDDFVTYKPISPFEYGGTVFPIL